MNVDNLSTLDTPVDLAPSFFLPGAISKPEEAHEPRQSDQPDRFHHSTASMRRRTNIVLPAVVVVVLACSDDTEPRAVAPELLEAQPDVAESRPDREAIRLALHLAETHYAGAR